MRLEAVENFLIAMTTTVFNVIYSLIYTVRSEVKPARHDRAVSSDSILCSQWIAGFDV